MKLPHCRFLHRSHAATWMLLLTLSLQFPMQGSWAQTSSPHDRSFEAVPSSESSPAPSSHGRGRAVIIGADAYLDERVPILRYCAADAQLIGKTLIEYGNFAPDDVVVLSDKQERKHLLPLVENIERQVRDALERAQPADTVLVYFSGHGFLDENGQGFLAPLNCQRDNLEQSSLSTQRLRQLMRQCKAKRKILVLDCCHAGTEKSAGNPARASSADLSVVFQEASGIITLASCTAAEVSHEWDQVGHGLFTHFFSQALTGKANANGDQIVDSDELYQYVFKHVVSTSRTQWGRTQRPVRFIPPDTIGTFALSHVVPRKTDPGAILSLYHLESRAARTQYEHTGAGTRIDVITDRSASWSPKRALFQEKPEVAQAFAKGIVAGQWQGAWNVPKDGLYTFQFRSDGHGWNKGGCCLRLQIGPEQVLDAVYGVYGLGKRSPCVKTVELSAGWHPVNVWLATTGDYDDVVPTIQFRAPGKDGFQTLSPALLFREPSQSN